MTRPGSRRSVLPDPIRKTRLPYSKHVIEEADIEAVAEILRSDWLTTGPAVDRFEQAFAELTGAKHAVAFSSATAGLHAAAAAAGLKPGDEAITSPITFCATANCVLYQGARVKFADVRADTLNIDPKALERSITPRTKAILPVDYAGHPADLDEIMQLAEKHGLTVIEDAAHAIGATYRKRAIGSISHMTVFSFHPVKHITTGEGGMVTTNDASFAEALRRFRTHGVIRDPERVAKEPWHYDMADLGWNYRISDIACALGASQLKRLEANLKRREAIAMTYAQRLANLPGLRLPQASPDVRAVWHLYPVRVDAAEFSTDREAVFRALQAEGIGVQVHYIPVHFHSYYRKTFGHGPGDFPIAEKAYSQLISLPLFHGMSDADAEDVIAAVEKVWSQLGAGR